VTAQRGWPVVRVHVEAKNDGVHVLIGRVNSDGERHETSSVHPHMQAALHYVDEQNKIVHMRIPRNTITYNVQVIVNGVECKDPDRWLREICTARET